MVEQQTLGGEGFIVDVRSLGRRPGSSARVQRVFPSPSRIGLDMAWISEGASIDMDLRTQAVSEGVLVTGDVSAPLVGECARCLEPLSGEICLQLTDLFAYPNSQTDQTSDDDEVYRLDDDRIDLQQAVIDAVATDLPLSPNCENDVSGVDLRPTEGSGCAGGKATYVNDLVDPRWAALRSLDITDEQ